MIEYIKNKIRYNFYRRKYNIDKSVRFNGDNTYLLGSGSITIGKESYIGRNSQIYAEKDCGVVIGSKVSISHNVFIYTTSKNPKDRNKQILGNVVIGNNVWVGVGVVITQNVTIGDNCIIGANSVVTKDILPNSTVKPLMITRTYYEN